MAKQILPKNFPKIICDIYGQTGPYLGRNNTCHNFTLNVDIISLLFTPSHFRKQFNSSFGYNIEPSIVAPISFVPIIYRKLRLFKLFLTLLL